MKKPKTLETKLRSAIRLIWSRSKERNAVKRAALIKNHENQWVFTCPLCTKVLPDWAGEVDHIEPIGTLTSWEDTVFFIRRMFFTPQRLVCKACHKIKTKEDMKRIRAEKRNHV